MNEDLTHLDAKGRPSMVDVSAKAVTPRRAVAEAVVRLPQAVADVLSESGGHTKKGSVFQTAMLAGTMAAKQKKSVFWKRPAERATSRPHDDHPQVLRLPP